MKAPGTWTDEVTTMLGQVTVMTTQNRGFTPEEIAERALQRFISVSHSAHPLLAEQAEAFRKEVYALLVFYMNEAIRSHKVTLVTKFTQAGYPELVRVLDT